MRVRQTEPFQPATFMHPNVLRAVYDHRDERGLFLKRLGEPYHGTQDWKNLDVCRLGYVDALAALRGQACENISLADDDGCAF